MSLRKTIEAVAKLAELGVIQRYAIAGAIAALNYVQPALTDDLDVLISVVAFEKHRSGLLLLTPIEKTLAAMGYNERTDVGYMIEGWPVRFLPVSSALDEEGLEQAIDVEIGVPGERALKARCLRAEHVVATAVKVGRLKDSARIEAFLEQNAVDFLALKGVLERHGLMEAWRGFCLKAGIRNSLEVV